MSSLSSSKPAPYRPPHLCKKDSGVSFSSSNPSRSPPKGSASNPLRTSSSSSQSVQSWRSGARPLSSVSTVMPSFKDLEIGMIFHLPETPAPVSSKIQKELTCRQNQNPWKHPVVVVRKYEDAGVECVDIRLFTSFGERGGLSNKNPHHHRFFMLADNSVDNTPHGNTKLVTMKGNARFGKVTYLNLSADSQYPIEYKHLELYNNQSPMQFDAISLRNIQGEGRRIEEAKSTAYQQPKKLHHKWR
jgi:hypothetical protein